MTEKRSGAHAAKKSKPVIRTFARGWLAKAPQFGRSSEGVGICRLFIVGEADGPASKPPRVCLYLKGSEAERCAAGLKVGDLIEGVGTVGPERERTPRQEVLVEERVKLRARAAAA